LGEELGTEGLEGFLEVVLLEVLFEGFEAVEHLLVVGKYYKCKFEFELQAV
jgi:hypothetical protein